MFDIFSKTSREEIYFSSHLALETQLYASVSAVGTGAAAVSSSGFLGQLNNPLSGEALTDWGKYFRENEAEIGKFFNQDGSKKSELTMAAVRNPKYQDALDIAISKNIDLRGREQASRSSSSDGDSFISRREKPGSCSVFSSDVEACKGNFAEEDPSFSLKALKHDLSALQGEDAVKELLVKDGKKTALVGELKKALRDPQLKGEVEAAFKEHGVTDIKGLLEKIDKEHPDPFKRASDAILGLLPFGKGEKGKADFKPLSLENPEEAASEILSSKKPDGRLERAKSYLQRLYTDPSVQNPKDLAEKFMTSLGSSGSREAFSESNLQELKTYREDLAERQESLETQEKKSLAKLKKRPPAPKPEPKAKADPSPSEPAKPRAQAGSGPSSRDGQ